METRPDFGVFSDVAELPGDRFDRSYEALVGLDGVKARLIAEARVALNPARLEDWSEAAYGRPVRLAGVFRDRPPLFLFEGDVGCGKTALAESFGSKVARSENIPVTLYRLGLNARGSGMVGEMTKLIAEAFAAVREAAERAGAGDRSARGAAVLVIDEADALAQSRETAQMHHEDRAGVNALISGIDQVAGRRLPLMVVMCTNRPGAIDPAVRRRAAATFRFGRPGLAQRRQVLDSYLGDLGFGKSELEKLARATGKAGNREYGATYADLVQRLLPALVLDAQPDRKIEFGHALAAAEAFEPSRPFADHGWQAPPEEGRR